MPLLENLFSHGAVERLGWMLVHFLWQAIAVAILLAVLLKLLRRASANLRYVVACGTLALMVATPLVTMQFVDVPGPAAEAGPLSEILAPVSVMMDTIEELPPLPSTPPAEITDLTVSIPWHERLATALEPGLPYVVLGWLAGVLGLSAWHLGGWTQLQRLKRRMVRETGDALHATLDELATRLGVRRVVTLLESAIVEVPTVVGWLRPTILLPASALTGLSPDQLKAILAHELAHIRRYDYLVNIVQTVVEILGFYHPAVWWVSHQIRVERENCCDDLAVRVCDNSLQYARALASMEEIRHSQNELAMAASGGSLMARIARLLGKPVVDDRRFTWLPGLIALLLVVGVVIPTAFALTRETPHGSESEANATSVSVAEGQDVTDSGESPQVQIQVNVVLAELYANTVLDPQTAEEVAGLLVRISAHDGKSTAAPNIDELRRPLADVLSTFAPTPGRGKEFVDLLRRKKDCVARTLSAPRVTVLSGETLSFTTGDIATPEEPLPEDSEFTFVCCVMTAIHVPDQNAVRMDIDMFRAYPVNKPSDPNGQTGTWTLKATVLAANNQWMTIADKLLRRLDCSGRECIQLPLVLATIVDEPEAAGIDAAVPMMTSTDGAIHLPPGMGALRPMASPDLVAAQAKGTGTANEPARTQVLLAFTVLDVVADRVLDADTAAQVRPCLTKIQAAEGGTASAPATPPLTEELLLPLRDVFTRFTPIPEKSKDLTDLLISRGYATILSKPTILTPADQPASLSLGEPDGPNAVNGYMRLTVNTHVLEDRDATRLEIDYSDRSAIGDSNDPNRPVSSTQIASTLMVPNNEYAALVGMNAGTPGANMRILLIGPIKVIRPQPAARQSPATDTRAIVKSSPPSDMDRREELSVPIDLVIAKVRTKAVPDRKTLIQIAGILAERNPQINEEIADADTRHGMTLGDILKKYVAGGKLLTPAMAQALLALLQSQGYVQLEAKPSLVAKPREQSEVRLTSYIEDPAQPLHYRELGTTVRVTAHLPAATDDLIRLKIAAEVNEPVPPTQSNNHLGVRHSQIVTEVIVPEDRYVSLLVEASGEMPTDANDPKATLVLLKARIDKPGSTPTDDSGAQAEKQSHQPQRVILNARVVEIDSRDLLNLGVAWGSPPLRTGQGPPDSDLFKDMQIGFTADRITTDSLMTKLRQLHTANRVHVMADPQFVSENGHPVQLLSFSEVWVNYADEQVAQEVSRGREECKKLFAGASLLVTPLVDDDNEITLEVEAETSKSHPQNGGASDLPIVTRRRTRSKLAIQDGGTVALAGLVGNPSGRNGPSAKTIVVFATASIIPETGPLSSPRPTISQKMQTQTRPEMTETRHLRLKHRTLQQVMDLLPSEYQEYIRVEDTGISDPNQSGRFLTVTGPASITDEIVRTIRRLDVPRQVLLDVHVVEIDRDNMAKLGIEWNRPTASVGSSDNTSWPKSIQIGHASNATSTDSLMRILNQLESTHQVTTINDEQLPVQDGSNTQLSPIQEEWYMTSDDYFDMIVTGAKLDRIRTWAIVSIVTRVADSNEITLEMAVSVDENSPNGATIDLPLDRLPQNRSPVTIQNGGTVILAGFPTSPTKRNRRSAKEIAIFVTAYLIPQTSEIPQKINGA